MGKVISVPSKNIKVEKDETFRKVLKQNAEFSTFGYQHSPPQKKKEKMFFIIFDPIICSN